MSIVPSGDRPGPGCVRLSKGTGGVEVVQGAQGSC